MLSCWSLTATEEVEMLPLRKKKMLSHTHVAGGGGGAGYGEGKDKDDDKIDKKTLRKDKKRPFIKKKKSYIYIHIGNTFSPPNSRFHDKKKRNI